jgi:two-component system response regulator (stage 0 sporulation protein F)
MTDNQSYINLLYVDDESINLEMFKMTFKRIFNVYTAESGDKGLEILRNTEGINVVISDMKMPSMTGLEFIQRAFNMKRSIKFFLLSGYSITPEIKESIESGIVSGYFQKPFIKSEIISSVNELSLG